MYQSLWRNVKTQRYKRRHKNVPARLVGKNESYFVRIIAALFKRNGWMVHHHDTRDPKHQWIIGPGFVDLILVKKFDEYSVVLYMEVKTERGYASEEQKVWLDILPSDATFFCRPSDWIEIRHMAEKFSLRR